MGLWDAPAPANKGESVLGDINLELFESPEFKKALKKHADEMRAREKECEQRGHPNAVSKGKRLSRDFLHVTGVRMYCPDCNAHYERGASVSEQRSHERGLFDPIYQKA